MVRSGSALGALVVLAWATVAQAAPDLLLIDGKVFTADPQRPYAEALAVEGGKVTAVGGSAALRRLADAHTRIIDAGGRLVTPGLTEAHVHIGWSLPVAPLPMSGPPDPGPSSDKVLTAVAAAAKSRSGWIAVVAGPLVFNDPRNWRVALDAAAPDAPVLIRSPAGHGTLLNSAALRRLGISDGVADPIGGRWGRDSAGRLDGRAFEGAETVVQYRIAAEPGWPGEDVGATAARYLGWGVTSVHVMNSGAPLRQTVAMLDAARTPLKWTIYAWAAPRSQISEAWRQIDEAGSPPPRIRIEGPKWVLDGTPIERGAWMRADYADRPGWRGVSNFTDGQLREILAEALRSGRQLSLHVVGDAETARLLRTMNSLAGSEVWARKRVRIEHGEGLTPDLIGDAKRLGVTVVQNPLHVAAFAGENGRDVMAARLGARADSHQPLRTLLSTGIPLALGSDAGGDEANPFLNLMLATRHRNAAESLSREQALLAYTSGGAYAERQEQRRGRLSPGMAADFAVLSQDVLTVVADALPATRSLLTVIDGRIVYAAPEFGSSRAP